MSRKPGKARRSTRSALQREQVILPPEGVPIRFRIAGLGERLFAQVADILLTLAALAALLILLAAATGGADWVLGLFFVMFFLVRVPYYILAELLWNGATLGKRLTGLRVVSADGQSLSAHAVVVRNLMKEAEVFLPVALVLGLAGADGLTQAISALWCLGALAIPLANRRRQRLGDLIAGTCVIHQPAAVLLPDAAGLAAPAGRFAFQPHNLDHYGAFEVQTLETILQKAGEMPSGRNAAVRDANLAAVVDSIRARIGYGHAVPEEDHAAFLRAFYTAQRAYLEQRQLFGERRADKHHRSAAPEA